MDAEQEYDTRSHLSMEKEQLCGNFRGTTYAKVNYPFAAYDVIDAYYKSENTRSITTAGTILPIPFMSVNIWKAQTSMQPFLIPTSPLRWSVEADPVSA